MLLSVIAEDMSVNQGAGLLTRLALALYRVGNALEGRPPVLRKLARAPVSAAYRTLSAIVGFSLPFATTVGRRLVLPHGFNGIFISHRSSIGDDVTLLHQVTIGSNYGSAAAAAAPILGNRVLIGAGAKIIGNVRIGDGARVGANALVVSDVPLGQTVVAPQAVALPQTRRYPRGEQSQ